MRRERQLNLSECGIGDEVGEGHTLARPTRAVADGVLLRLLLLVTVPTEGVGVGGGRLARAGEALLGERARKRCFDCRIRTVALLQRFFLRRL